MSDKHHPGDWIWLIHDGRMVAVTFDAFDVARSLAFDQASDAWEEVRAKGHAKGDFIVLALQVMERSGKVRIERRDVILRDGYSLPVYAVVPPEERQQPPEQRAKRTRRKRASQDMPPALVLVQGGSSG